MGEPKNGFGSLGILALAGLFNNPSNYFTNPAILGAPVRSKSRSVSRYAQKVAREADAFQRRLDMLKRHELAMQKFNLAMAEFNEGRRKNKPIEPIMLMKARTKATRRLERSLSKGA